MKKFLYLLFIILASFVLAGCNFWKKSSPPPEAVPAEGSSVRNENSGIYEIYTEELAASEDKKIVLFFSAAGCKECRELENDIQINRDSIPSDVVILKVDADVRNDLKEKYNTDEGGLIRVDSKGDEMEKIKAISLSGIVETL